MKKLFVLLALGWFFPGLANAADCFLSYYGYIGRANDGKEMQVPKEPAISTEKVTFTTSSVQSGLFPAGTSLVGVVCNGATSFFAVGANPTATTNNPYLAADVWFFFAVDLNSLRIAFRTP